MTSTGHCIAALAREYRASELLAAAAARAAAEVLARQGGGLSADALHDLVDQYRLLLLDALAAVDGAAHTENPSK